jgi:hypothetical protein
MSIHTLEQPAVPEYDPGLIDQPLIKGNYSDLNSPAVHDLLERTNWNIKEAAGRLLDAMISGEVE